jgi:hypothetical protein
MNAAVQPLYAPDFFGGSIRRVIVDEKNWFFAGGFPDSAHQGLYVLAFVVGWDYKHSGTSERRALRQNSNALTGLRWLQRFHPSLQIEN